MFLIILGFILFVGLVVIHEYGHFIVAKRNGVDVEEFGIGFPPRAKTLTKKNGTEYTLNWLPLGGFVRLKGENDADDRTGTFGAASLRTKVKIMLAGVVMNTLAAFVIFTLLALVGMPKIINDQFTVASDAKIIRQDVVVGVVVEGSPAQQIGLQERDRLIALEGIDGQRNITRAEELSNITESLAGQEVFVTVGRDGEQQRLGPTTLRTTDEVTASQETDDPQGYLGVLPGEYVVERSTWSAPIVAVGFMGQITYETFRGLGTAIGALFQGDTATAGSQVSGIIGIGYLLAEGSSLGISFVLLIVGVISLTLAIMNALPIPALDGGRLFVTLLYKLLDVIAKLFDKRVVLTPKIEEVIHGSGFIALMLLFVVISIVDIKRFF